MSDTSADIAARVFERHRRMSALARMQAAAAMFDAAREIIRSSLEPHIAADSCAGRLALARRLYAGELPEAALLAFADYHTPAIGVQGGLAAASLTADRP